MAPSRTWRAWAAICLLVLAAVPAHAADTLAKAMAGPDWPHSRSELSADPDTRYGRLPNGMRYVIHRNRAKARGGAMRLEIAAGSLQERDDQLGLAHFVEHMAFRGSKHQSDGELTKTLKREGFSFGSDVNAFTDYETTKYVLDLPSNEDEPVDSALFILREIAGYLTFDDDAITHERGVILGEERLRASATARSQQAFTEAAYKGDLYALRDPIGSPDIIRNAPRQALVDYYQDWYRPELAVLVVVGDFDVDKMERRIATTFGDWQPARPGPVKFVPYGHASVTGPDTTIYAEKNLYDSLGATWFRPYIDVVDSYRTRTNGFLKHIAVTVINQQFARAAEAPNAAFLSASLSYDNSRLGGNVTGLSVVPKPGRQKEAFVQALRLFNRFKAQGVSQPDIASYIATTDAQMENLVRTSQTEFSNDIADEILSSLNYDSVYESATQYRADWARIKPALTPAAVAEQMQTIFAGAGPLLNRQGQDAATFDAPALAAAYAEAATAADDTLPEVSNTAEWPYTDFGPAKKPVATDHDRKLDYGHYRFANGVTANIKYNPLVKNEILVTVRFEGGYRLFSPSEHISLQQLAVYDLGDGGLGKLTASQVGKALSKWTTGMDYDLDEEAATLTGRTTRDSFPAQMQLLMAYATDPGFRPESFDGMQASLDYVYQQLRSDPSLALDFGLNAWLSSDDPRYVFPPRAQLEATKPDDFFAIYRRTMRNVPVEVTITGDIREGDALAQLERTFANLPPVPDHFTPAPAAAAVALPADRTPRVFTHEGRPDQAIFSVIFPATGALDNLDDTRGLTLLSAVFNDRLDDALRTRLGLAYDGNVSLTASEVMKGYGYIEARGTLAPDKDQVFYDTVMQIAADLVASGVTADELERARNPLIQYMNDKNKNNDDWQATLAGLYGNPVLNDYRVRQYAAYMAVTPYDVQQLAGRYLKPDKVLRAGAVPAPKP